jgi:hypothetical protein
MIKLLSIFYFFTLNAEDFKYCTKYVQHSTHITKLLKNKKTIEAQKQLMSGVLSNGNNFAYTDIIVNSNKKRIYRSGYLTYSPACIKELSENNLKLVINISYTGDNEDNKENHYNINNLLTNAEKDQFSFFGVKNYYKFNIDKFHQFYDDNEIANIITYIKYYTGDILIHCYSGIHRTGMIFGIIQKCLNNKNMNEIISEYKKHASYINENNVGSYRQNNIDYIENFNCSLIK